MWNRMLIAVGLAVAGIAIVLVVLTRRSPAPTTLPDATRATPITQAPAVVAPRDAAPIDAASIAARIDREHVLAGLVESGSGAEAWDTQATAVLDSLAHGGVAISNAACYVAGCGATFTFPSDAAYNASIAELERSDAYKAWTGGKRLTTPELGADGRVTIAVVLYRPD